MGLFHIKCTTNAQQNWVVVQISDFSLHTGMSGYPESTTIASSENRILNPDIEPAVRFKLRQNI